MRADLHRTLGEGEGVKFKHCDGFPVRRIGVAIAALLVLLAGVLGLYFISSRSRLVQRKIQVTILSSPPSTVEKFSPIEIDLNVSADYDNPFDPSDINVTAVFKGPSREIVLPTFYYQEYERGLLPGGERLAPLGEPHWRVRFTPVEEGLYEFYVEVSDRWGNRARSETLTFEVRPSALPGFVRVHEDGRYFVFDNGSSAFFVGLNTCWSGSRGTYDYDEWFRALADSGVNLVRIWMAPWCFGIEWDQLGRYNLREAWKLDYVIKLAEKYNIYVILCLMNHGQLSTVNNPQWNDNPYNKARGGPLSKPEEFWTSEEARELFKRRLRYVVARWGYSTHLLAWELWNEVDLTDNYDAVRSSVAQWHREMASYLKQIDPYRHLVTTSFANPNLDPLIWSLDEIDFVTIHRYGPEGFQDLAGTLHALVDRALERYGKPVLVTEFGVDWRWWGEPLYYRDKEGLGLHDGLWATIMAGSPATAMSWWWDNYIHPYNLYYHFKGIAEYLKGLEPARSGLRKLEAVVRPPEGEADVTGITVYPALGWARPATNYFVIHLDGRIEGDATQIPAFIQGRAHPQLRNNPTFRATFPKGGRVAVKVNSVSSAGAVLAVYVDGSLAKRLNLPDRDGKNDAFVNEYGIEVEVEVPPGTHEVRIDNLGNDWYTIDYVRFDGAAYSTANVKAFGLTNGSLVLLWVKNSARNWWNALSNQSVKPVDNFTLVLKGLLAGVYEVSYFDTRKGTAVRTDLAKAENGVLELQIDSLYDDLAIRARKVG